MNDHVGTGNLRLFSLCSHQRESLPTEQKLILGTCAAILLHYLKENSYFGKKLPTTILRLVILLDFKTRVIE